MQNAHRASVERSLAIFTIPRGAADAFLKDLVAAAHFARVEVS